MSKIVKLKLKELREKFPKLISEEKINIRTRVAENSRFPSTNFLMPAEIMVSLETSCYFEDGKIGRDKVTNWLRRNNYSYSSLFDAYLY